MINKIKLKKLETDVNMEPLKKPSIDGGVNGSTFIERK